MKYFVLLCFVSLFSIVGNADVGDQSEGAVEVHNAKRDHLESRPIKTGKKAADKYFLKRSKNSHASRSPASGVRYMAIHVGFFPSEDVYKWRSSGDGDRVGRWTTGVTYRIGEWTNSMDLGFRAELTSFKVEDSHPLKLSLLPVITFPDAKSGFPLYFGAGAGLGVFFKQAQDESSLSLDYQIFAGVRFPNLLGSTGFLFETGLKSHLHLLSDGQYNGVFVAAGAVFDF